jgi:hypothetical protein
MLEGCVLDYLRRPLSPYLGGYISELLPTSPNLSKYIELVEEALRCTCHVARIRSVAHAVGHCAYYARMAEKIGVFEVISRSVSGKGKALHKLLALTSQDLFSKYRLGEILKEGDQLIKNSVEDALEELGEGEGLRDEAISLLKKLLKALLRAQERRLFNLSLDVKFFPIVEQEFIDFDDHMYGAPDLILEDPYNKRAIVIEWKSYEVGERRWDDVDIAQVVAYAIMEARRLGIKGLREVFKAISGIEPRIITRLREHVRDQEASEGPAKSLEAKNLEGPVPEILKDFKGLRILSLIISDSNSFPPHPMMYEKRNAKDDAKRFYKLYKIFKGIIVAADHLTLQLTNVERLLEKVKGWDQNAVKAQLSNLKTHEGYLAFNYTPFKFLRSGKPREQLKWPCRAKSGKLICPFAGEGDACEFYFGRRDKWEFESFMWRSRYKVFDERERSLANYKAMDILLRDLGLELLFDEDVEKACKGFKVDIAGRTAHIERHNSVVFYVKVRRGYEDMGKFHFDVVKPSDVRMGCEEESLIVERKLREVEKSKGVLGIVKKSVAVYVVELGKSSSPLLSLNTFLMVGEPELEEDRISYYLYNPSLFLHHNFELFKRYVTALKDKASVRLLMFEAPTNLTQMELRAIDALHRYMAHLAKKDVEERVRLEKSIHGADISLSDADIKKEIKIVEEKLAKSLREKEEFEKKVPLCEVLKKVFGL